MTDDFDEAVRPDMAEGELWIETPQTAAATTALHSALDLARRDGPGWQPVWVLCGPAGTGKTSVARRFAAQARRAATCDAVAAAERSYREQRERPQVPSPERFRQRDAEWAEYRAAEYRAAMDAEARTRDFGYCPQVCRPVEFLRPEEFLPESVFRHALERARDAHPVSRTRMGPQPLRGSSLASSAWSSQGNETNDPIRRTSMAVVDDVERLTRLPEAKRAQIIEDMLEWPAVIGLRHRIAIVLVGSPKLAAAVAECRPGAVQRIELPPMPVGGPGGAFSRVCQMVFGSAAPADVARLHQMSGGAMGPLLAIAHMQGLRPPYAIGEGEILRLPSS